MLLVIFQGILVLLVAATVITVTRAGPAANSGGNSTGAYYQHPYQNALMDSEAAFLALSEDHHIERYKQGGGPIRSPRNQREPRFISFQTRDNNIEVEVQFAIPFLSVPVKKSVDGMMSTFQKGTALLNVNVAAVALAGILALGSAFIGGLAKLLKGYSLGETHGPLGQKREDTSGLPKTEKAYDQISWWTVLEAVDKSLQKFDIDSTACTQRTVCWYVKEAMNNVEEQRANNLEILVNGLSSADWAMKFTTGTAIEDAIRAGRRNLNCEQAFPGCRLGPDVVQRIINSSSSRSRANW
ncbi:uncharacterized protein LOC131695410 [Topomyia yanbarensis]|uniref:uncharacterized protein LOC131695410 n=1 Tax=Topomyia yanbarensis TaxID=2498891 RepID=UPI00273A7F1C|nr:uncharacterized protein LOC131695410 [Topomyia yanbarensis]